MTASLDHAVHDDELHAFVDGQLDADRLPAVLAWLHDHPDDAEKLQQWQAQRLALRRIARETEAILGDTPPELIHAVRPAPTMAARSRPWALAAALLASVAVGVVSGRFWQVRADAGGLPLAAVPPVFVQEAAAAYAVYVPEKRHPVEVAASDEAHLVQWLSKRLGAPLKAPNLNDQGYRLLGGRLLPGEGVPRAQFMYEDAQGRRVTLYVAVFEANASPAPTAFRSVQDGNGESFYWTDSRFGYALNARLSPGELQAVARAVYAQLAP